MPDPRFTTPIEPDDAPEDEIERVLTLAIGEENMVKAARALLDAGFVILRRI